MQAPALGREGDDEEAAGGARLPGVRDAQHDAGRRRRPDRRRRGRRAGRLPLARPRHAPARRDARRHGGLARRGLGRPADVGAAARAAAVLRARRAAGRDRAGARPADPDRREGGRRRAGDPRRRGGRRGGLQDDEGRGRRPRRARAGDRPAAERGGGQAVAGGASSRRPSSPGFSMPAAGWAAKSGDPVLWVTRDAIPAATRAAITAHKRPRIYVLGPEAAVSKKVLDQLSRARRGAADQRRRPGRQRDRVRALLRRLVRLERRRSGARARVREHAAAARRRRGGAALGVGDLRPAAARHRGQRAAGAAAGLPARHPARLRHATPCAASTTTAG